MTTKTNQEIDFELALAIGYAPDRVRVYTGFWEIAEVQVLNDWALTREGHQCAPGWYCFDHTDPAVIWPIAERFDCFARKSAGPDWWTVLKDGVYTDSNCAATASALAVIKYFESKA